MRIMIERLHTVRTAFVLIAVILLSSNRLVAQRQSPLVARGSVAEVKVEGQRVSFLIDPKNEWGGRRWERKDVYFTVIVGLQLCNQGEERLIVPNGNFYFGRQKLLFRDLPSSDSKVTASIDGKKATVSTDDTDRWVKELEKPEPSTFYFAQIEPGTCFEHSVRIPVDRGFRVETRPSNRRSEADIEFTMPDHPYFTIQFSRSMPDSLPIVQAKARWQKLGRLVTTADNNFFLETELIINKLPDFVSEKP